MPLKENTLNEGSFKEPMVVFPLRHYESLMEHIEDIEDRLAIYTRASEPNISQKEVEDLFERKFGRK